MNPEELLIKAYIDGKISIDIASQLLNVSKEIFHEMVLNYIYEKQKEEGFGCRERITKNI